MKVEPQIYVQRVGSASQIIGASSFQELQMSQLQLPSQSQLPFLSVIQSCSYFPNQTMIPSHSRIGFFSSSKLGSGIYDGQAQNGIHKKKVIITADNYLKYTIQVNKSYNPYLIPPDWSSSKRHAQAKRVGRNKVPTQHQVEEQFEVCPCCDYQIVKIITLSLFLLLNINQEKTELSLIENANSLSFLGSGYPLFFHYMKYCIVIIGLIILTSGEYNLLSNFFGGSCLPKLAHESTKEKHRHAQCVSDWISVWSIANKHTKIDYAEIQDILNFSTVIVLMILLFFFRKEQKEIDSQCDMAELTPADYTILIKNLHQSVTKEEIKYFFENSSEFQIPLHITDINFVYDLNERTQIQQQIEELVLQKQASLQKIDFQSPRFNEIQTEWDKKIDQKNIELEAVNTVIERDSSKFSGQAFISFQNEDEKQSVLESAKQSLKQDIINGMFFQQNDFKAINFGHHMVEVSEAPEPLDIIWENLYLDESKKKMKRYLSAFITVILFLICSYMVYSLITYQADAIKEFQVRHQKNQAPKNLDEIIEEQLPSAIVSFCMVCINSILIEMLLREIVKRECHSTHTHFNINLAQKLSLALFINTAIISCLVNVFYTENIYGKGGLIYTIFYFCVVNAISSFLTLLFDPLFYLRKILVSWHQRKGNNCKLTQQQANKLCEFPVHEIEIGYVDIMKTIYITVFYSPVVPLGLIISLIGFIAYYWAQKFVILKERIVDKQISVKLSLEMTEYLEFIISIYTASNLLFKYETVGEISYLQIIGFILGCIYSFLPIQIFIEKFFFFHNENESVSYENAYPLFQTTYAIANPVTSTKAKQEHYERTLKAFRNKEC